MKSVALWCLTAGLTLVSLTGVQAADEAVKGKKKNAAGAGNPVFNLPKEVELTAEQQEKLMAVKKEFGPKVAELQKKLDGMLSADQIQARKDVMAKLKNDTSVKGKARQEAIDAALNLTSEQKSKWEASQGEMKALQAEVRGKIAAFLTEEQKAKVPSLAPKKTKKPKKTT